MERDSSLFFSLPYIVFCYMDALVLWPGQPFVQTLGSFNFVLFL